MDKQLFKAYCASIDEMIGDRGDDVWGVPLYNFFRWEAPKEYKAELWKYALSKDKSLYDFFYDEMLDHIEQFKTSEDIKKFSVSEEFKLLKHDDKIEIATTIYSNIPKEYKKFREGLKRSGED